MRKVLVAKRKLLPTVSTNDLKTTTKPANDEMNDYTNKLNSESSTFPSTEKTDDYTEQTETEVNQTEDDEEGSDVKETDGDKKDIIYEDEEDEDEEYVEEEEDNQHQTLHANGKDEDEEEENTESQNVDNQPTEQQENNKNDLEIKQVNENKDGSNDNNNYININHEEINEKEEDNVDTADEIEYDDIENVQETEKENNDFENEETVNQNNANEVLNKINSSSNTDAEEEEVSTTPSFTDEAEENEQEKNHNLSTLPDYEPFFPELSESLDAPVLLLKTTVIPSVDYETKTVVQSRLRTYTFIVTRVNGDEKITTSTTEVKPQTKTLTVTEPRTSFTTLTLLDWEATNVLPYVPLTKSVDTPTPPKNAIENDPTLFEEARYNLATRVMSNGVEVIVAGDKTTLPGEPDVRRIPPSSIYKPITLKPSTLTNHMSLLVPQDASQIQSLSASLQSNPFITRTCLTTFTYLTTYLQNGSTAVSSHEQVVSNIATEEKNSAKIIPTASAGVTLTQHPNLAVGIFQTTYTYLNTILDGEQPLVVSSKHVVSNTVTAPDDYLSLLLPSEKATPVRETNTYYSTLPLQKTIKDGADSKLVSTEETLTQVIITQSIPPKSTSVMTSYIALDVDSRLPNRHPDYTTTDVVKTYYVTYTYYSTATENNIPVLKTNVAISTDIVTEKLYINPQKTSITNPTKLGQSTVRLLDGVDVVVTKTYVTTYTYYTTLLQNDKTKSTSTIIKSHTKELENVVTETLDASLLQPENLAYINQEIQKGQEKVTDTATLKNGQKVEITAINKNIKPTKVLPIEKTQMPSPFPESTPALESTSPGIITGSTIVFFDEDNDPFKAVSKKATPTLKTKLKTTKTAIRNELNSLLSSEIVKTTKLSTVVNKQSTKKTKHEKRPAIIATKTKDPNENTAGLENLPPKKKTTGKVPKPVNNIPDLLGLGTINVETLSALTPVINAMAGLIKTNIKNNKRNDSTTSSTTTNSPPAVVIKERHKEPVKEVIDESQNKPIYIPLQQAEDDTLEIAESQNIATFHIKQWEKLPVEALKNQKESPLLNGGIPISPGEIITANSDVIVGKPGRIGPRVPSIPLEDPNRNEAPIGMSPPPLPHNLWPNRNTQHLKDPLLSESLKNERPYSGKETYHGPPPPMTIPLRPSDILRGEYQKRPPVSQHKNPLYNIPPPYINELPPRLSHGQILLPHQNNGSSMNVPIQPSELDELIVLPEVIERSSGQPLLVNLQPSQVAYVNIPHNRSTALIYGGSTEPHINGQYFDDPSPYTQLDFAAPSEHYNINNQNNGILKVDSIQDNVQSPNQKRVVGVIKVGSDVINVNPTSSISVGSSSLIQPSKPLGNKDININLPPLSFGMIHQAGELNGHVINHQESITFKPPPMNFNIVPTNDFAVNEVAIKMRDKTNGNNVPSRQHNNYVPIIGNKHNNNNQFRPPVRGTNNKYAPFGPYRKQPPKSHIHTRPPSNLLEYMTPPPPVNQFTTMQVSKLSKNPEVSNSIPISPHVPQFNPLEEDENYDEPIDSFNEEGEYVQESNNRPLYPDEIPPEILKLNGTRQRPPANVQHPSFQTSYKPTKENANRNTNKATNIPFVRPENQLTNQIIKHEDSSIYLSNDALDNSHKYPAYQKIPEQSSFLIRNNTSTTLYLNTEERLPQTTESTFQNTPPKLLTTKSPSKHTKITTESSYRLKQPVTKSSVVAESTSKRLGTTENRPKVTSMPVDFPFLQKDEINRKTHIDTQTEKPFNSNYLKNEDTTTNNYKEKSTPQVNREEDISLSTKMPPIKDVMLHSMEIMKPPPPPPSIPPTSNVPYPSVDIKPPKISDYGQKPYPFNFVVQSSSPRPFSRNPTVSVNYGAEEIFGMNPPAITTYRPKLNINLTVSTYKPIYSLQLDASDSEESDQYSTTTHRTRRPYTRKPYTRRTTTSETHENLDLQRSTAPPTSHYPINSSTPTSNNTTTEATVRTVHPIFKKKSFTTTTERHPSFSNAVTNSTTAPKLYSTTRKTTSSTTSKPHVEPTTKKTDIGQPLNNQFEIDKNNNHTSVTPLIEPSRELLPTHEQTHIHTFTTTTIRTTVIKTLNGPASTSTVLVTRTEKFTVIDTVTEIHTLVKPTSIYETITTTLSPSTTLLYPPGVPYGNQPSISPTTVADVAQATAAVTEHVNDNTEDFIIRDNDETQINNENDINVDNTSNNDSIFVVMTDKNHGSVVKLSDTETQNREETVANSDPNHILLGGVLIASPPNIELHDTTTSKSLQNKCIPDCQASKNELCQRIEGVMRCVCRPGFARMFPDRPCKPTYTYRLKIVLERHGKQRLVYHETLNNSNSTEFVKLSAIAQDGLDRMVMQSDLRDIYHGIQVENYEPLEEHNGIVTNFYLQLSENTNDDRLKEILKKYLRNNNYSIGGMELYAAREGIENLDANDFDECSNKEFHDCSENAHCFNLPGTYTCSCKEGFADLSENTLYPGRICSAELIGCERCNYHGTCYSRGDDEILCECFQWYAGGHCHINLKVLLIALITLGSLLFVLLIVCLAMTCSKGKRHQNASFATGMSFMPQRVAMPDSRRITLERRAMIQDTSSESGQSDTLPYEAKKPRKLSKGALKKPPPPPSDPNNSDSNTLPIQDQKDRSLTVMIPRAKYHPPPHSPVVNPESCDNRKSSIVSSNEAKLLSYLDAGPTPNAKTDVKRKYSNAPNETYLPETVVPRKQSAGALVSAGFEVSATVNMNSVNNLGTFDTAGGTEADRSENATLIQKISADLISSSGTRSQFNTLRNDFIDPENEDSLTNWLEITPKITKTVSEARSCDETTIQPPTKSLRNGYDINNCNDEANTMAERDVGSTFLLPHTHLYKPDKGSDISGFDSL